MNNDEELTFGEAVKQLCDEFQFMESAHLAAIVADFICNDRSADTVGEVCALLARMANDDGKGTPNKELSEMFMNLSLQYGSYEDKPATDH
jgi:hypothetical protein